MTYIPFNKNPRYSEERSLIRALCERLFADGYDISVHNGEDFEVENTTSVQDVIDSVCQTDYDTLIVSYYGERVGFVSLVWGNDPSELISDYSPGLGEYIEDLGWN